MSAPTNDDHLTRDDLTPMQRALLWFQSDQAPPLRHQRDLVYYDEPLVSLAANLLDGSLWLGFAGIPPEGGNKLHFHTLLVPLEPLDAAYFVALTNALTEEAMGNQVRVIRKALAAGTAVEIEADYATDVEIVIPAAPDVAPRFEPDVPPADLPTQWLAQMKVAEPTEENSPQ